jgi:hypothetical protein
MSKRVLQRISKGTSSDSPATKLMNLVSKKDNKIKLQGSARL